MYFCDKSRALFNWETAWHHIWSSGWIHTGYIRRYRTSVLGITLGDLNVLDIGTYDGSELGLSKYSTDGTVDGNIEGLLLQV